MEFQVGMKFNTHDELVDFINKYQKQFSTELWRRDSRTIATAVKIAHGRSKELYIKKELEFAYIVYDCIHGGRNYESKSKGLRPNQR